MIYSDRLQITEKKCFFGKPYVKKKKKKNNYISLMCTQMSYISVTCNLSADAQLVRWLQMLK